ncbi:MAG: DNA polymerase IV [Candidatus Gygaella obscura]|nr:DNA polymerase IV [Candidatus Gygaella obscura]
MIIHIDMDAFFASIEQAVNPTLKGLPLIVGSRGNKNYTVVCAASYEAKRLGIDSGMPTKEAFLICPQAEFVPADSAKYVYTSEVIFEMLFKFDPNPQYVSIDEFQLDLRDTHPEEYVKICNNIKRWIVKEFNITCSIGVAKNCLLAKLASKLNKPDGVCILDKKTMEKTLKNTDVGKLSGIGKVTLERLNNLGFYTCLDLYNQNQSFLNSHFGKVGFNLFLELHGQDSFSLNPQVNPAKSIGHSYTLNRSTNNQDLILNWIRLLSEMVSVRLRKHNLTAKTISFWYSKDKDFKGITRQKTFQLPTNNGQDIYEKTCQIWRKIAPNRPFLRALGVSTSQFQAPQKNLLKEIQRREDISNIMDKINQKYGDWTLIPAQLIKIYNPGKNI